MTKKNIRNKELYMESIKRGSLVGGIIWVCVVIFISINYKTMGKAALPWLVPMLDVYKRQSQCRGGLVADERLCIIAPVVTRIHVIAGGLDGAFFLSLIHI